MIDPLPSDIFQTGQVLNNTYEIQGVLGRGGTGEVYQAVNQVTGRVFAIKALNAQFSGNADYLELMKREEEMRSILHDAVVRYNECSRTDSGHVYLVMDYIAGPSLADVMSQRRVEPRELLIIAHRVAEGLVATHSHGIVHRDLSPDNIILRDGKPDAATIIDFGIAKDTAAGARTIVGNEFAGKYEYAAPEQLEGHAEARTDLYALGATLLAAFRGDIPYLGTTPGEIVRRKQNPLDTKGVPEPLKALIDRLTAPRPEDRPATAAEVVSIIEGLLKPSGHRAPARETRRGRGGDRAARPKRRRNAFGWIAVPAVAAAALAGAYAAGLFDGLFAPPLPVADPYELSVTRPAGEPARLAAHAPDAATADMIREAFVRATGAPPENADLTLATGLPAETWPALMSDLIGRAGGLPQWDLSVSGMQARLGGVAADAAARESLADDLTRWAASAGIDLRTDILAGPVQLAADRVRAALAPLETCGPLTLDAAGPFALGDTITVSGDLSAPGDETRITQALTPVIGSRSLRVRADVLNEELCAIRAVLPPAPPANLSVWLGNGTTGEANFTGVFTTGENPVVEIHAPSTLTEGYLWVMVVDNTGKVFHIVPNINQGEQRLAALGTIEGGLRRIRVLHPVAALREDSTRLAITVNQGDYGKSEVIAILSRTPLFDMRRPKDESVASVAAALAETLEGRDGEVIGVAARIIDARP